MRILFLLCFIGVGFLFIRSRWLRWKRRLRGEPEPQRQGPGTIVLVAMALLLIYGLLLGYRILTGSGPGGFL